MAIRRTSDQGLALGTTVIKNWLSEITMISGRLLGATVILAVGSNSDRVWSLTTRVISDCPLGVTAIRYWPLRATLTGVGLWKQQCLAIGH